MLKWDRIEWVLLDMDGTLLDLQFDNRFWQERVPEHYAEQRQLSLAAARQALAHAYDSVQHTLSWYCLDYWETQLGVDIRRLKAEYQHEIRWRDDAIPFLRHLQASGRKLALLTNAHPDNLAIKNRITGLDRYVPLQLSSHEVGAAKEEPEFWLAARQQLGFDESKSLLVDDNLKVLQAAAAFGIGQQLAITNPDSGQPESRIDHFPSTGDYRTLLAGIPPFAT